MNIYIILNDPYPYGMANANRIHLYARGLIHLGHKVKICIPKPKSLRKDIEIKFKGIFDEVAYQYPFLSPHKSSSFLKRRFHDFFGPLKTANMCLKEKPDALIVVSETLFYTVLFKLVARLLSIPLVLEKSEVPFMHLDKIDFFRKKYLRSLYSMYDGIIVITQRLDKYLRDYIGLKVNTVLIPILIDERFVNLSTIKRKDYILYSGSLYERKDGIITIMKAFAKVVKVFPDTKFYITGKANESKDYIQLIKVIEENDISNNVVFTGFVSQEELFMLMREARLLILAKPDNRQNEYNFPTKLGEYLISGTPVLCTMNENLEMYFSPEKNIYDSILDSECIYNKIVEIFKQPSEAEVVGAAGKQVAVDSFSAIKQVGNIAELIENYKRKN